MSENYQHQHDDIAKAVMALQELPVPEGPPVETVSRTLAALREAAQGPKRTLLQRIYHLPWKSKVAAVLGIVASALVVYAALATSSGGSIALAQVIDKIVSAKTISFVLTLQSAGDNTFFEKGRMVFDETNDARADMHVQYQKQDEDLILILNVITGKSVLSVKGQKVAITDLVNIGDQNFLKQSIFDRLELLAKESTHSLGTKQIDGVDAAGFEITKGVTARFWVNAKTGDPVYLEIDGFPLPEPVGRGNIIVNDFKIDGPLDPSLFDTQPPEGYFVIKSPIVIDLAGKPANDVAMYLRFYAKESGGRFPERLIDANDPIFKKLDMMGDPNEKITAENAALGLVQGGALPHLRIYMAAHQEGTDYEYYPGIKLGEKDPIVFWSRNTKTGDYMAVYGDLRVEKVEKEQLPQSTDNGQK